MKDDYKHSQIKSIHPEEVPLKDDLFLSPIEKYKIYGRFPWKMIIHIFLVIVTTAQGIMTIAGTTQYTRAQERLFYNFFVADTDRTDLDYSRKTYLYSVSQLRDHIKFSLGNFYNIQSESLELVEYLQEPKDMFINMHLNYLDKKVISTQSKIPREFNYKITNTSLGPFDFPDEDVKSFLNSVTDFQLNYTLKTFVPFYYGDNFECFFWNIHQLYSFVHRAHFVVRLQIRRSACSEEISNMSLTHFFVNRMMWIHIIVLSLAFASLILTWKHVYKMAKIYWRIKRGFKNKNKFNKAKIEKNGKGRNFISDKKIFDLGGIQEDTELGENQYEKYFNNNSKEFDSGNKKLSSNLDTYITPETELNEGNKKLFNMWSVICLIGNVIQIFGSALSLFDTSNIMSSTEVLVGFGCMLAYINVGRYLEYNRDYSTIFATIKRAMPNVLRYLFGVMPIFFGFIFFGLCLFWRSERFVDTSSTMMTLFAMLNGDSVFDIFHDLSGVSFFLGQLYCYTFCIIFVVVVMNVFISIIEEAYVSTKMKNQNHWIYSYLKIDPDYVKIKDLESLKENDIRDEIDSSATHNHAHKRKTITSASHHDISNRSSSLIHRHNKEHQELFSAVKSKNILREAVSIDKHKYEKQIEMNKQELEKTIEVHFSNVRNKNVYFTKINFQMKIIFNFLILNFKIIYFNAF